MLRCVKLLDRAACQLCITCDAGFLQERGSGQNCDCVQVWASAPAMEDKQAAVPEGDTAATNQNRELFKRFEVYTGYTSGKQGYLN